MWWICGEPIGRFLTFLELQSHTGEGMSKQALLYLREVNNLDLVKCRDQSYDNVTCQTRLTCLGVARACIFF